MASGLYSHFLQENNITEWLNFYVKYDDQMAYITRNTEKYKDIKHDAAITIEKLNDVCQLIQQRIRQEIIKVDDFFVWQWDLCVMMKDSYRKHHRDNHSGISLSTNLATVMNLLNRLFQIKQYIWQNYTSLHKLAGAVQPMRKKVTSLAMYVFDEAEDEEKKETHIYTPTSVTPNSPMQIKNDLFPQRKIKHDTPMPVSNRKRSSVKSTNINSDHIVNIMNTVNNNARDSIKSTGMSVDDDGPALFISKKQSIQTLGYTPTENEPENTFYDIPPVNEFAVQTPLALHCKTASSDSSLANKYANLFSELKNMKIIKTHNEVQTLLNLCLVHFYQLNNDDGQSIEVQNLISKYNALISQALGKSFISKESWQTFRFQSPKMPSFTTNISKTVSHSPFNSQSHQSNSKYRAAHALHMEMIPSNVPLTFNSTTGNTPLTPETMNSGGGRGSLLDPATAEDRPITDRRKSIENLSDLWPDDSETRIFSDDQAMYPLDKNYKLHININNLHTQNPVHRNHAPMTNIIQQNKRNSSKSELAVFVREMQKQHDRETNLLRSEIAQLRKDVMTENEFVNVSGSQTVSPSNAIERVGSMSPELPPIIDLPNEPDHTQMNVNEARDHLHFLTKESESQIEPVQSLQAQRRKVRFDSNPNIENPFHSAMTPDSPPVPHIKSNNDLWEYVKLVMTMSIYGISAGCFAFVFKYAQHRDMTLSPVLLSIILSCQWPVYMCVLLLFVIYKYCSKCVSAIEHSLTSTLPLPKDGIYPHGECPQHPTSNEHITQHNIYDNQMYFCVNQRPSLGKFIFSKHGMQMILFTAIIDALEILLLIYALYNLPANTYLFISNISFAINMIALFRIFEFQTAFCSKIFCLISLSIIQIGLCYWYFKEANMGENTMQFVIGCFSSLGYNVLSVIKAYTCNNKYLNQKDIICGCNTMYFLTLRMLINMVSFAFLFLIGGLKFRTHISILNDKIFNFEVDTEDVYCFLLIMSLMLITFVKYGIYRRSNRNKLLFLLLNASFHSESFRMNRLSLQDVNNMSNVSASSANSTQSMALYPRSRSRKNSTTEINNDNGNFSTVAAIDALCRTVWLVLYIIILNEKQSVIHLASYAVLILSIYICYKMVSISIMTNPTFSWLTYIHNSYHAMSVDVDSLILTTAMKFYCNFMIYLYLVRNRKNMKKGEWNNRLSLYNVPTTSNRNPNEARDSNGNRTASNSNYNNNTKYSNYSNNNSNTMHNKESDDIIVFEISEFEDKTPTAIPQGPYVSTNTVQMPIPIPKLNPVYSGRDSSGELIGAVKHNHNNRMNESIQLAETSDGSHGKVMMSSSMVSITTPIPNDGKPNLNISQTVNTDVTDNMYDESVQM